MNKIRIPSYVTMLVEANIWDTIATKWAPISSKERAVTRAANEHDDEMVLKRVAKPRPLGGSFPKYCVLYAAGGSWFESVVREMLVISKV